MEMTDDELKEIRARCDATTPGEWRNVNGSYVLPSCASHPAAYKIAQLGGTMESPGMIARSDQYQKADCAFIVSAKSDVPRLLYEIDRLKNDIECWEGTKEGAAIRISDLEKAIARLKGTDGKPGDYTGWTIVSIGENDSLLLESPRGDRRRVWFREREILAMQAEIERLRRCINGQFDVVATDDVLEKPT